MHQTEELGRVPQDHAVVIRTSAGLYLSRDSSGTWICNLRGKLRNQIQRVTSLVSIGDRVILEKKTPCPGEMAGEKVDGTAVIREILPRKSTVSRLSPGPGSILVEQILAVNVDQAVIVVAAARPPLKLGTIERLILMSRQSGVDPLICINKVDQVGIGPGSEASTLNVSEVNNFYKIKDLLEERSIEVVLTSAQYGYGVDGLKERLLGKTSVFLGPSGVGKTSILKAMTPQLEAKTLAVNRVTGKGKHSTTYSALIDIGGGYIADLPGMKTLGLWQLDREVLASEFEDIEAFARSCRFRNCSHTHEPDCAVKEAVKRGEISRERYVQYVKLSREVRE